eukprot:6175146-Amphidinium_carterae.1
MLLWCHGFSAIGAAVWLNIASSAERSRRVTWWRTSLERVLRGARPSEVRTAHIAAAWPRLRT